MIETINQKIWRKGYHAGIETGARQQKAKMISRLYKEISHCQNVGVCELCEGYKDAIIFIGEEGE